MPPQNVALTRTDNEHQLIKEICGELIQDEQFRKQHTATHTLTGEDNILSEFHKGIVVGRADMKTTHEESGKILVQQMVFATQENQEGISVIAVDTGVLCFYVIII